MRSAEVPGTTVPITVERAIATRITRRTRTATLAFVCLVPRIQTLSWMTFA